MKKVRINLQEKFPNYFAVTERTEAFAELAEEEVSRLEKVESALSNASASAAEVEEEEEAETAQATVTTEATAEAVTPEMYAALEDKIKKLENLLDNSAAASATTVTSDATQEGGGEEAKSYATSVDAELDKFFK